MQWLKIRVASDANEGLRGGGEGAPLAMISSCSSEKEVVRGNTKRHAGFALAADIPRVRGEWVVCSAKGGRMLTRVLMISKEGR